MLPFDYKTIEGLKAEAAMTSADEYKVLSINASGRAIVAPAGGVGVGSLVASGRVAWPSAQGDPVALAGRGTSPALVGVGGVVSGQQVEVGAGGTIITAAGVNPVYAIALESGAAGDIIAVNR